MKRAIILSGGAGERLRPLTADKPKAMVEINGKPIMAYQIEWLVASGITDIIVACGYRHEVIKDYFGNGQSWKINIEYLVETTPLGRGGALKHAMKHVFENNATSLNEPILALNGDLITNLAIDNLMTYFNRIQPMAVIATVPLVSPFGILELNEIMVTGFSEKPKLPFWINAGIYAFAASVMPLLPDIGDHEVSTLPILAERGELVAYKSNFFWRTVDTIKDVRELQTDLKLLACA